jgi:hypothetical protein
MTGKIRRRFIRPPNNTILLLLIGIMLSMIVICDGANTRGNSGNGNNNINKKHGRIGNNEKMSEMVTLVAAAGVIGQGLDEFIPSGELLHEDHVVVNLALNKSVRLSSSASADGNYGRLAVDGDESTFVETALEKTNPYIVVDLGAESYIDEITLIGPYELGEITAFAMDQRSTAFSRNLSDLAERANWQTSATVVGNHVTLHAHTTGRYVRVQRLTPSKLAISEFIVRGVKLSLREKAYSQCLSGHDGSEVCSSRGVCARGRCNCGAFYTGFRCERVRLSVFTSCTLVFVVFGGLVMFTKRFRSRFFLRKRKSLNSLFKKRDPESSDASACEDLTIGTDKDRLLFCKSEPAAYIETRKAPSESQTTGEILKESRARSTTPSNLPRAIPTAYPAAITVGAHKLQDNETTSFKLHVLFASPLVMLTHTEVIPVAQLDVERECELLHRSLAQAGAHRRVNMEVTCATIDALQSVLTLREASVIHISSHCQPDLMALEDTNGAAHFLSVEALNNLLAASKPTLGGLHASSSRLVVLNCCHSSGVAQAFIRAGFQHVVALSEHFRVRDVTAATFTRAFYLALASAHTVGDAFRIAREAVSLCPGATAGEADAFVLLPAASTHEEVIWPKIATSPLPATPAVLFANPCQVPTPCEDFVGRSHEMWTILQMLQRYRMVHLYGRKGCGKTATLTQLANHIRIRKSESSFVDGVFYVCLDQHLANQDDEFSHELICGHIADTLVSAASSGLMRTTSGGLSSPSNSLRRSINKANREQALLKFGTDRPSSVIILDSLPATFLESQLFTEFLNILLRASPKLHVVSAGEPRVEKPTIRVVNVLCGPLNDIDSARLLIRLCHSKLVAPSVLRTEPEFSNITSTSGLDNDDDEFESTAKLLSKSSVIRSLMGHPESIHKLASQVNAKSGMGGIFSIGDIEDLM